MKTIQALILAGGEGKRMWPLTLDKNLTPFLGKTIIEHTINDVIKTGIKEIIIVTNIVNNKKIKDIAAKKSISIKTIIQQKPEGMANALLSARPLIKNNPLLVLNASDLYNEDAYSNFIKYAKNKKVVFGGLKVFSHHYGGYFRLKENRVVGLIEKPAIGKEPSIFFKTVVDYFQKPENLFFYLTKSNSKKDDLYEIALDMMIKNENVNFFKIKGYFQQLKHPWHILAMMEKFLKYRLKKKVIIKKGVKLLKGAIVKGPSYLGKNTIIGNNALVRNSMIGENSIVGYNTEIARSWLGNNCCFHSNYIGDSVIEGNSNFGSGAKTANLRLDEKEIVVRRSFNSIATGRKKLGAIVGRGVKVGINASIMPGTLIGSNSFVGPGVVLKQNLKDDELCFLGAKSIIKKKKG